MTEDKTKTIKDDTPSEEKNEDTVVKTDETPSFKGKYISVVGKRKTSIARVRLYKKGNGAIVVNDKKLNEYFDTNRTAIIRQPLKLTGHF